VIIDFLKRSNLIENLNIEIGKAGIVGEENSRMLLIFNYHQLSE
jgi:DNA primase